MNGTRPLTLALVAFAACSFGPRSGRISSDLKPGGARVRVGVGTRNLVGELVAVADRELLLLLEVEGSDAAPGRRLVQIARSDVDTVEALEPAVNDLRGNLDDSQWNGLRLVARHPQGTSPELVQQLLGSLGQDAVERVPR